LSYDPCAESIWRGADTAPAHGTGVTGDISEVKWDNDYIGDYRTGFEGTFRLMLDPDEEDINQRLNIGAEDDEEVVGLDVEPLEGQRVVLMAQAIRDNPSLWEDSKGGPGTILWVDPEDADGDGITGDICEVEWDLTNLRADYRTGFEGTFRLALFDPGKVKKQREQTRIKEQNKGAAGRKARFTIDQLRKQAPDDPWKFWDDSTAEEERLQNQELYEDDSFTPEPNVAFRMMPSGPQSSISVGSWKLDTKKQNNGSTIQIKFDPASNLLGNRARLANDAKRLGLRFTHGNRQRYFSEQAKHTSTVASFQPFAAHLTGEGLVIIAEHERSKFTPQVSKAMGKATTPGIAVSASARRGLEEMSVDEAMLVVEGIPRHSIDEVLSLKRNEAPVATPAHDIAQLAEGFSGSESGSRPMSQHSSSRPGSRGFARMSMAMEKPVPQSIRSIKRNAPHERPITPVTGKPYTALRPSSRGSVRHALNLEDAFGVGQDMLSRNAVVLKEHKSKEGDFGRQMRLATEANLLIEDDEVR
jgi:hypothetical protein